MARIGLNLGENAFQTIPDISSFAPETQTFFGFLVDHMMVPWYLGTTAPSWYDVTKVPWYHGNIVPWYHGAMVPWRHGTMVTWYHGAIVPWYNGTMVPWAVPW